MCLNDDYEMTFDYYQKDQNYKAKACTVDSNYVSRERYRTVGGPLVVQIVHYFVIIIVRWYQA